MEPELEDRILRMNEVKWITGKCRSAIYAEIKDGYFPRQRKLGPKKGQRAVGWSLREIENYIRKTLADGDNSAGSEDTRQGSDRAQKKARRGKKDVE